MSYTLLSFLTLSDGFAYFSDFYRIFVPYLCRDKKVGNLRQITNGLDVNK